MSVDYRTEIVYGVLLDKNEIDILNQKNDEFRGARYLLQQLQLVNELLNLFLLRLR